ncbi:MAG TPA: DUF4350 domain-containing protein, partial [Candidatus Acidoferrales bacterium]|nr:DUF4350 domain-containing protein [Candidatus Acidoferrales bacterium]
MSPALASGDRKLLVIGGSVLLLLIIATLLLAPPPDEAEGEGIPTTYSAGTNGAQAAYELLGELGYQSQRWERPPSDLPSDAAGKILILAGPLNFPDRKARGALLAFVRSGGWIIYAGNFPFHFLESGDIRPASIGKIAQFPSETFHAITPSPLTQDADTIAFKASNRWVTTDGAQLPLYGAAQEAVVVTWKLDKGRVIWWAAPTPVTNSGISREENLAFFLDCIRAVRPGADPGKITVLWDEYFHGYRGSLWDYFRQTPVPWAVLQLSVVALFVLLAFSRRNGPIFTPAVVSRLSPLEFVDTLGDLYRRGRAGPAAVRVAYKRFRTQ